MKNKNITIVGLWHLGSVYTAGFSKLGFHVVGFDFDEKIIFNLNRGEPPIFEPNLSDLIKLHLGKNLVYTSDKIQAFKDSDYIFLTLDTPVNNSDEIEFEVIEKYFDFIIENCKKNINLIISSQIPIGSCQGLNEKVKRAKKDINLFYLPENLRLGKAIDIFLNPDWMVVGSHDSKKSRKIVSEILPFKCPVYYMNWQTAEMVKHSLNIYLSTLISLSSELSDISELAGADYTKIVEVLKNDRRVSSLAPINPGLGFAGGTLGRDLKALINISKDLKLSTPLLNSVYKTNKQRINTLIRKLKFHGLDLTKKRVGILGLTYKPNTNTLRRSMSLELAKVLHKKNNFLKGFDPVITEKIPKYDFLTIETDLNNFFRDLDLVILMTDWPEFSKISPQKISKFMKDKMIYDTKNQLNKNLYKKYGIEIYQLGIGI